MFFTWLQNYHVATIILNSFQKQRTVNDHAMSLSGSSLYGSSQSLSLIELEIPLDSSSELNHAASLDYSGNCSKQNGLIKTICELSYHLTSQY